MKETIRTARKKHRCGWCNGIIYPGNKYLEIRERVPVGDEVGQTGIEYFLSREHLNHSCKGRLQFISVEQAKNQFKFCDKGQHDFKTDLDPMSEGETFCSNCGIEEK